MTKGQWGLIIGSVVLLGILYFGCETKTDDQKVFSENRATSVQRTSAAVLIRDAKESLKSSQLGEILLLEEQLEGIIADSLKVDQYKQLSKKWYDFGYPSVSGHYAEQIALQDNTEEAWSITGTTFVLCLQQSQEEKVREFCIEKAISAFEKAISINPENVGNKVNLALTYVENPPSDNPMRGILMLRNLNEENPQNTQVLNQLARLAIRTGQFERAIERLNQVLEIEADNKNAVCLLAQAHQNAGNTEQAALYQERCSE